MRASPTLVACLVAVVVSSAAIGGAPSPAPPPPAAAADRETVVLNTKSLKFHCRTCGAAVRCTKNCTLVTRAEAVAKGGVPCKECGGTCR